MKIIKSKKEYLNRFLVTLLLFIIISAGFIIRINNINASFFYDEAVYADMADNPLKSQFYSDIIFFRHPPLYTTLLMLTKMFFGYSELAFRIPSILFGCATILLCYFLGKKYKSEWIGLVAATLLTFNVIHQQYSQAATMYSALCFFTTLAFYGVKKNDERITFLGIVLAMYTNYFGLLLFLALGIHRWVLNSYKVMETIKGVRWYIIAYLPWIPIAIQGGLHHLMRGAVESPYYPSYFQISNLIFHSSITLLLGFMYYVYKNRRNVDEWMAPTTVFLFITTSLIICPFHRYILFILPIVTVLGVLGISEFMRLYQIKIINRYVVVSILLIGLFLPNLECYGIYPHSSGYLDERDMIHKQQWQDIVGVIDYGLILTYNRPSLKYYLDIEEKTNREIIQYSSLESLKKKIQRDDARWVIISKQYPDVMDYMSNNSGFSRYKILDHLSLYKKDYIRSM